MKRLSKTFFNNSLSEEKEEDDDDFEMAIIVIVHEDFRQPRLGSLFSSLYIDRGRVEGHAKLAKD